MSWFTGPAGGAFRNTRLGADTISEVIDTETRKTIVAVVAGLAETAIARQTLQKTVLLGTILQHEFGKLDVWRNCCLRRNHFSSNINCGNLRSILRQNNPGFRPTPDQQEDPPENPLHKKPPFAVVELYHFHHCLAIGCDVTF